MRHPFFQSQRPLVFAHRGGGAIAPENTLAAFDNAAALGADGLELDVHLSRDGRVMVHHDRTLDRTTDLTGPLAVRTADELAAADAGFRFLVAGARPFAGRGVGVPTLDAVLSRYRRQRLIIELKVSALDLVRSVVEVVRAHDAAGRVCLGSFWLAPLRAARAMAPEIATSAAREEVRWALYRSWCRWPSARPPYAGYQVPECSGTTRVVSRRFIEHAHRAGLGVQVWTVDSAADASRLLAWGADALITDRPDRIVPVVPNSDF